MTSERAQAYGRIVATIEDIGATKLQPGEIERIRTAADTLLFSEDLQAPGAREALDDTDALIAALVESDRWTDERAERLLRDLTDTGPVAHVG